MAKTKIEKVLQGTVQNFKRLSSSPKGRSISIIKGGYKQVHKESSSVVSLWDSGLQITHTDKIMC